jgi:N-acyl-D-amino-acid deacylase
MIDMALERDMKFFMIQPIANEDQAEALELMKHPRSVVTFSDSGAHVSQIMDSSLQTHLLSHWVRDKQAFTLEEAVKMITCDTATQFGFHDRGLLREGMAADIVVFDPATVAPRMPRWYATCRPVPRGCARRPTACAPRSSAARCCCATTGRPATCRASSCAGARGTG